MFNSPLFYLLRICCFKLGSKVTAKCYMAVTCSCRLMKKNENRESDLTKFMFYVSLGAEDGSQTR